KILTAAGRALDAVADLVALGAAAAADGVVAPARVLDNGEEAAPHVRVDPMPRGEKDRPGVLHGVRGIVALRGIGRVIAEKVDGLAALEIDDAQHLALPEDAPPVTVGRNDPVLDDPAFGCRHSFSSIVSGAPRPRDRAGITRDRSDRAPCGPASIASASPRREHGLCRGEGARRPCHRAGWPGAPAP